MAAQSVPVIGELLETNRHLYISCLYPDCRREVRLSAVEAVQLLGRNTPFVGLAKRLRCTQCGRPGRDGKISVWPCTLDWEATRMHEKYGRDPAMAGRLQEQLAVLRKLLGDRGELGGGGPVTLPEDADATAGARRNPGTNLGTKVEGKRRPSVQFWTFARPQVATDEEANVRAASRRVRGGSL